MARSSGRKTQSRAQRLREEQAAAQRGNDVPAGDIELAAEAAREAEEVARLELENSNQENDDGLNDPIDEEEIPPNDGVEATKVASMFKRLGMSKDAANYMVNDQSLNNIEVLTTIDDKEIALLCKSCRKDATSEGGRKGIPVAVLHETNFELAVFRIKLWKMTSRPIDLDKINGAMVREIKDFKETLTSRKDPKQDEAPTFHQDKAFEFFELFRDYLAEHTGSVSKRPLAYVIREKTKVVQDGDPPFGKVGSTYISHNDEIEHRAPIKVIGEGSSILFKPDPHFTQDNVKVYKLLHSILKETSTLAHIKKYSKKSDGREAVKALRKQLLGAQAIANYVSKAENRLQSLVLDGTKKKNWNFGKYVTAHMEQHHTLEKLKAHGYGGIDELSKMRHFQKGITDPYYNSVRAAIAANPRDTFSDLVEAYRTFSQSEQVNRPTESRRLNISALSQQTGNRSRGNGNRPTTQSDNYDPSKDYSSHSNGVKLNVYYKGDDWNNLTANQRNYLRSEKAKKKAAGKENKRKGAHLAIVRAEEAAMAEMSTKIQQLETMIASIKNDASSGDSEPKSKRTKIVRHND